MATAHAKARSLRTLLALLTAVALAPVMAPAAHAAKPVTVSCGETITTDTKFAKDLINCPEIGIVIGADGITLDLNGHTVDGAAVPWEECAPECESWWPGILNEGHDGTTIEGGTIRQFADGVVIAFADGGRVHHISSVQQRHEGFVLHEASGVRLDHNSAVDSGFQGIFAFGSPDFAIEHNVLIRSAISGQNEVGNGIWTIESPGLTITGNYIEDSHAALQITEGFGEQRNLIAHNRLVANDFGIMLDATDDSRVVDNAVSQSGVGITVFGDQNRVTGNRVAGGVFNPDGDDIGIELAGGEDNLIARNQVQRTLQEGVRIAAFEPDRPTVDNVVSDNRVRDAGGDGYAVATQGEGAMGALLLENNFAFGAGDDGLDVRSPATTLTSNLAFHNADLGIAAVSGVVDGGGNKARGNGNPLECTNVFCG